MTRQYKTSKKNRINYIYYTAEGTKIVINPGENGVTEADIGLLHSMDDLEVDEQRRYQYRTTPNHRPKKQKQAKKLSEEALPNGKGNADLLYSSNVTPNKKTNPLEQDTPSTFDDVITVKKKADPFADLKSDPLQLLLLDMEVAEHEERLLKLTRAMDNLTPAQLNLYEKVYVQRRTNTSIAAEEGVTEAAIRNRLKKMHEKLRKIVS
ncbi:RNA polymerase sigma factor [Phosphitispora sp. TUW77]|uniref:RNA polymerase sigma factor n=1 Tax=Phosphitispora sp. TUW77 TaxID=3152361 RepID=UPI003AB7098E